MKISRIKLSFSNAYLVQDRRTILVDTGMPGEERKILQAAEKAGVKAGDIRLILHTHGHVDHAGSTAALAKLLDVPIAIHRGDETLLRSGRMNPLQPLRLEARLIRPLVDNPFPPVAPDLLVDETTDLAEFGVQGRLLSTPGHTAGSISLLLPNGEAIVGDVMMGGYVGGNLLGTRPNYHYFADDLAAVRQSIHTLLAAGVQTFHVGHGGPLAKGAVTRLFNSD
ncbi:MAG TPA: MBL fold metallo-hydrolase [Anaerolineae bacterium]|nr:MBL fold metallo-hydrolase [Anaerolineae bacterium]